MKVHYAGGGKVWKPNPPAKEPLKMVGEANPNPQPELKPDLEDRINRLLDILDITGEVLEGLEAEVESAQEQVDEAKEEAEEAREQIEESSSAPQVEEVEVGESNPNPNPAVATPVPVPIAKAPLLKRLLLGG